MESHNPEEKKAHPCRPVRVELEGRSTKRGAYTQPHIYSLRQRRELPPRRVIESRTGHHWLNVWFLCPGRYFAAIEDRSNSGKNYSTIVALVVDGEGWRLEDWEGEPPKWANLPPEVLEALGEVEGEY